MTFIPFFHLTLSVVYGKFNMIIFCLIGDKMKRINKILSLILCLVFLFTSCVKTSKKSLNEVKEFFAQKQYNECYQYLSELNDEKFSEIKSDVELLLVTEFNLLTEKEKVDLTKPYTLTKYNSNFTETCRKLWNIASLLDISSDNKNYTSFAYIRYFAESNNFMRFSELYALMSSVNDNGYISKLHTHLNEYNTNGDYSKFESIYNKAKEFDYSQFDPQEYQVDNFRNAHDKLLKALHSLCNGFATNNSSVVASSVNSVYDSLSVILSLADTLKSVRANQRSIYNTLFTEKIINKKFNTEIEKFDSKYTINSDFGFDYLFNDDKTGFIDNFDISETTDTTKPEMPLKDAIKVVINALNKTKNYKSDTTVTVIQNINIDMTDFESDTKINSANEITKSRVNQILDQANGTRQLIKSFSNGVAEDGTKLNTFIPPQSNSPSLNENDVESYSVTKGSGGQVIVFNLKSTETSKAKPIASINTIANGFRFDNVATVGDFKTYYSPCSVMFIINNSGYLAKMQYSIDGVSECTFYENGESVKAEFDFTEKYSYSFSY